ncbi:MAG: dihydroorotase [Deltaproteobacteria bacterium HGW-Deltaproteobacteria-15]|nr:MAG: dihydroorotase [Deltaproteobacteria bacterium HGW-Deltaproteobacteria-15]
MAIWITGGRVVDPLKETMELTDLLIDRGKIIRMVPAGHIAQEPGLERIDATGCWVIPGLIDMHVHLREPGQEYKETIATGGMAAVSGGFTAVACMPNTNPVNDNPSVTTFILEKARDANLARVFPIAAITRGSRGESLTDFAELRNAGAVAVSDDGRPVSDPDLMKSAMESARRNGLAIISHCENVILSAGGVMHQGSVSAALGYRGIPARAEEDMVAREITLSRRTGCPVHIAHVSTAGSVRLIKQAKEDNLPVTAETAPHYFTLDHTAVMEYSGRAKMNPPLRRPEDVQAVREALSADVIDVIATDHAPHADWEKEIEFERALFGITGLETALPLVLELVRKGYLTPSQAVRKLSHNPANILGLEGGGLMEGGTADITIVDPEREYVLMKEEVQSKSRNSPFLGRTVKGRNLITMIGGRVVWKK